MGMATRAWSHSYMHRHGELTIAKNLADEADFIRILESEFRAPPCPL